jgi:hypothetical protein
VILTGTLPERDGQIRRGSIVIVPVTGVYPITLDLLTVNAEYKPQLRIRIGEFVSAIVHDGDELWSGVIIIHGYRWDISYNASPPYTLTLTG